MSVHLNKNCNKGFATCTLYTTSSYEQFHIASASESTVKAKFGNFRFYFWQ